MQNSVQRTVAPVTLETPKESVEGARLFYGDNGIYALSKNKKEVLFSVEWEDIVALHLYQNRRTLGVVHFLLVIPSLYLGIIGALFLPQLIMHFIPRSRDWSGYGEIVTKTGEVMRFTPAGLTRVGFHAGEPKTIKKYAEEYSPLARVTIEDPK